ncbi:CidA/LrgA family protein [soil metagenome]
MKALQGLALLLLLQAAGESISHAFGWPIPGPVVGLVLLLACLTAPMLREPVEGIARLLLGHLSLLFVPIGVGVITHLDIIDSYGMRLLLVIAVSTWVGLAVTALVFHSLGRR